MATGVVASFDDAQGWGYVRTDDGAQLFFHCTVLADGARTIDPGTAVDFDVVAGHRGRFEARNIRLAPPNPRR